jgi:hypothetical protein
MFWRNITPRKHWAVPEVHNITTQMAIFFIVTAVRALNPTVDILYQKR